MYCEKYKPFLNKSKETPRNGKIFHAHELKELPLVIKMPIVPRAKHSLNVNPIKVSVTFSTKNRTKFLKFIWNCKRPIT